MAEDGGSAGDGNSLLQVFAQIHPDSSFEKIDLESSFGNPQTLIKINLAILNKIYPGSRFGTICETPDLFQLPSPILIQILIDIACSAPIALLLSHSFSHSHSSFQVHAPIHILICYLYSLIS